MLACDAGIIPTVLGGHGQPIDVGRERRLYTGPPGPASKSGTAAACGQAAAGRSVGAKSII